MLLRRLWLEDFRSYDKLEVDLGDGLTAIIGPNGSGKTNVLEAVGLLATLKSFRGVTADRLIRRGQPAAIVRAEGIRDGRDVLIELEVRGSRVRAQVNRQKLQRTRDLLGALRITVFAPDDLALIKEGPSIRRDYLDDLAITLDPRRDAIFTDADKVLKQRNALLKQLKGKADESALTTLDVWDEQLSRLGEQVLQIREEVLEALMPRVGAAYALFADKPALVIARYQRSWSHDSLAEALADRREDDLRRAVSTVGPHRDDISLTLDDFDSRTEASQGEQRTLALALRFAGHELVTDRIGEAPLLLLDDVLSELDPDRAAALLDHLPPGQTLLTSATDLPSRTRPDQEFRFINDELVAHDAD